ncbi:MAG: ArsR family transcriptional regulator [Hyphomonadaceae bacterium BRH_c29]|nr:MAG: ArsR family transcriptional regulator [Hyphomonadaceae bacterium BRH_c29]
MQMVRSSTHNFLKALSNEKRLQILEWILTPRDHFPEQQDGDLVEDGVCIKFITDKIALSQPTVTSHMAVLAAAGLVTSKQIKNWVFYKPDRSAIQAAMKSLRDGLDV